MIRLKPITITISIFDIFTLLVSISLLSTLLISYIISINNNFIFIVSANSMNEGFIEMILFVISILFLMNMFKKIFESRGLNMLNKDVK